MVETPPKDQNGGGYRVPPEEQRRRLDNAGFFWEQPKTANETDHALASLVKIEEAKARQEEAKAARNTLIPPKPASPESINLEWAMPKNISALRMEYLVDPFLPAKCVVGFFGRGSTAKSSFLATLAARISNDWSTLWVSVEELTGWITQRHIWAGGDIGTLAAFSHTAVKRDGQGRVVGSTFDIYRDLESAIVKARAGAEQHYDPPRPLRLVVLDTAVGLTGWAKGENPNDDAAVKRVLAYLQALAETYDVCIAIIGHTNKAKHDHFADTVAGSSAWTNSPRLSFVHARDRREDYAYVLRVAKSNLSSAFAVAYTTEPVLQLHQHEDGHASVLCRVVVEPVVWGEEPSMELYEEATRRPDAEGEGGADNHRQSVVEAVMMAVVEMVYTSAEPITREQVEVKLNRAFSRREWKKVDDRLSLAVFRYKVAIGTGPQNKVIYQRQT